MKTGRAQCGALASMQAPGSVPSTPKEAELHERGGLFSLIMRIFPISSCSLRWSYSINSSGRKESFANSLGGQGACKPRWLLAIHRC